MNLLQSIPFLGGFGAVIAIYASGIACQALLDFEPPALEVAIGGVVTIAVGRTGFSTYESMTLRRTAIETGTSSIPGPAPSTIPPGG